MANDDDNVHQYGAHDSDEEGRLCHGSYGQVSSHDNLSMSGGIKMVMRSTIIYCSSIPHTILYYNLR